MLNALEQDTEPPITFITEEGSNAEKSVPTVGTSECTFLSFLISLCSSLPPVVRSCDSRTTEQKGARPLGIYSSLEESNSFRC